MSIESVMPSNHLITVAPFSSCLQSFPASGSFPMSPLFTPGGQYWSFSFSISPFNEYSGLISFRIDGFDLLVFQDSEVFSSTIQKHQFFGVLAFFMVQFLHPFVITGKTIALTRWIFVSKVMSLLFNLLS